MPETQTITSSHHVFRLPAAPASTPYRVLVNGFQSWSDAELRFLTEEQTLTTIPLFVPQGHDLGFPPSGRVGAWRSHGVIALLTPGTSYVAYTHSSRDSLTFFEARLEGDEMLLEMTCDGEPVTVTLEVTTNPVATLEAWAARFGAAMEARVGEALRVWCSWYAYYRDITFDAFMENARLAKEHDLPFDVLQLDDGFQAGLGDWLEVSPNFGRHHKDIPAELQKLGFRPGIWLAPFIANASSRLFQQHPDWFLRDANGDLVAAGDNWGGDYYGLDTSLSEVQTWLEDLARTVVSWGYTYLKLDFLFAAAMPAHRKSGVSRVAAYRMGLEAIRRGAGEGVYILGCGAPLMPSVGLVDAMRVGPDTAPLWDDWTRSTYTKDTTGPSCRNAIKTVNSRWYQTPWYRIDADIVFFRSRQNLLQPHERRALEHLVDIGGGLRATSDPLRILEPSELEALRAFLERHTQPQSPRDLYSSPDPLPTQFQTVTFNWSDTPRDGLPPHGTASY
jgi:alpha-galactosidase